MAEVFRRVNGRKFNWVIARTRESREAIDRVTIDIATQASANLARHRFEGDARIDVDEGDVDQFVVLDDSRGLGAALSIEYGTKNTEATRVLRDAAGLR